MRIASKLIQYGTGLARELSVRQIFEVPSSHVRTFSTTSPFGKTASSKARKHRAPYLVTQAKARKANNLVRQEVLRKEREEARGDPIRGITTPFVESFDTGFIDPENSTAKDSSHETTSESTAEQPPDDAKSVDQLLDGRQFNHHVHREEILEAMQRPPYAVYNPKGSDDAYGKNEIVNDERFKNNAIALARILNLSNGSSLDLLTHNTKRCIETFGRHNTDKFLPPKPPSLMSAFYDKKGGEGIQEQQQQQQQQEGSNTNPSSPSVETPQATSPTPARAGLDTGSSEVQIAILTAKIRALAAALEKDGRQDKMNKRNLRVLVHRRQKLLRYLRRKERGGPRWQHLVEKLGLTEGTWNGEISL